MKMLKEKLSAYREKNKKCRLITMISADLVFFVLLSLIGSVGSVSDDGKCQLVSLAVNILLIIFTVINGFLSAEIIDDYYSGSVIFMITGGIWAGTFGSFAVEGEGFFALFRAFFPYAVFSAFINIVVKATRR